VSTKNFPENTENFSIRELFSINFVSETRLLAFVFEIFIIGQLIILYLSYIGMVSTL